MHNVYECKIFFGQNLCSAAEYGGRTQSEIERAGLALQSMTIPSEALPKNDFVDPECGSHSQKNGTGRNDMAALDAGYVAALCTGQ